MTTDKSKSLTTTIKLLNEKLHFEGKVEGNEAISLMNKMKNILNFLYIKSSK